jgi:hypothetical protein
MARIHSQQRADALGWGKSCGISAARQRGPGHFESLWTALETVANVEAEIRHVSAVAEKESGRGVRTSLLRGLVTPFVMAHHFANIVTKNSWHMRRNRFAGCHRLFNVAKRFVSRMGVLSIAAPGPFGRKLSPWAFLSFAAEKSRARKKMQK